MLKDKDYYPHINLLRGIAAMMVCIYHYSHFNGFDGPLFSEDSLLFRWGEFGAQGVTVFFVISGFVIPLSMQKGGYGLRWFGRFLLKRSIRIEPPYIAAILLMLLTGYLMAQHWESPFHVNPVQFLLHIGYLIPFSDHDWYNPVFWTLAIEFQYYILMALLFPLLTGKHRWLRHLTLLFFFCGHFLPQLHATIPHSAAIFIPGIVLFLFRAGYFKPFEMLAWVFVSMGMLVYDHSLVLMIAAFLTFLAIWLMRSDTRLGNWFGNISYSLYLLHGTTGQIFLLFRTSSTFSDLEKYAAFLFAVLIAVASAFVFWFLIEQPSRIMSQSYRLKKSAREEAAA